MKYLVLDTNVLISLSLDRTHSVTPKELKGIRNLLDSENMQLILPTIVELEFKRNVKREFERSKTYLSKLKENIKSMIVPSGLEGDSEKCKELKDKLKNTVYELYGILKEFNLDDHISPVIEILSHTQTQKADFDNELFIKGYRRIVEKKAPSHNDDQLNDNIITESIIKYFTDRPIDKLNDKAFFVSYDFRGFADEYKKDIHPDLKDDFENIGLKYSPFLAKLLKEEFDLTEIEEEEITEEEDRIKQYTPYLEPMEYVEISPHENVVVHRSTGLSYSDQLSGVASPLTASLSGSSSTWRPSFVNACLDTLMKPNDFDK